MIDNPLLRFVLAAVGLLVCGVIVVLALSTDNAQVRQSKTFLESLRNGSYAEAFHLLTPDLQMNLGDPKTLAEQIEMMESRPLKWQLGQGLYESRHGIVSGSVEMQNGTRYRVELRFHYLDGEWRIAGYSFLE